MYNKIINNKSYLFRQKCLAAFVLLSLMNIHNVKASQSQLKLWYTEPATDWMTSALPIGSGSFGGMFYGGVAQEHMQFNDKSLWSGSKTVRGSYQNFGDLFLNFTSHISSSDYVRELNLDEAIGRVSYNISNVCYLREYFASNPDSVIVMRITAPGQTGKLSFTLNLTDAHTGTTTYSGNKITISGTLALVSYEAQVAVINDGGTLTTGTSSISIANADAVTIILTGATNFNPISATYIGENTATLHARISTRINKTSAKSYDALKTTHLADYQPKFNRVKLDLDVQMPNITTDELIRNYKTNSYLDILYFQYGRYLMLCSSRGMALPSNLQGLWNNSNAPAWQCDIHNNINVQMNYWPAENTNLSECHLPFTDYIANESGKINGSWSKMASTVVNSTLNGEKMTGYSGWTQRTQNNIFGYSDWNWNRPANSWYCMHMWQHFAYTKDTTFLTTKAFPAMKSACQFWFDRLKVDENGKLIAPDECSPEQGTWEDNVAYAQQLIWELFDQTLKATKIVKTDQMFIDTLTDKLSKLDNGVKIGPWGEIREWTTQPDVQGNTHRHLSNLIALYPGNQISYHKDSTLVKAAIKTLNSRGDGGTGWSRAWKIACWARLFDGDHAYKLMKAAQNLSVTTVVEMNDGHGGVYENLLDAHPSYQIDGNFGFTAGVAEMLVQSNQGFIQLLPALPAVWPNGSYSGLKAMGNFTVDVTWKSKLPQQAVIYSGSGDSCKVYYPSIQLFSITDETGTSVPFRQINQNVIVFQTLKNKSYTLIFNNIASDSALITPYVQIDTDAKIQSLYAQLKKGQKLVLSPESSSTDGLWSWTGPNNFTSTLQKITLNCATYAQSGNYMVTYTMNGSKSYCVFTVTVIEPHATNMNVLKVGDYYIKKRDTQLYWTNTAISGSGGMPLLLAKECVANADTQVWNFRLDGGRYKIVSKADGRYINEKGNFGTNAYLQTWNTFNIYSDSIYNAFQITGNSATSGAFFWNYNTVNSIVYSINKTIDETKDLIFELISSKLTDVKRTINFELKIWSEQNRLHVKCEENAQIFVYNQMGVFLKQFSVNGEKSYTFPNGFYIVRAIINNISQTTKVVLG